MPYCPECGGNLFYDSRVKRYVCKSCGLSLTFQEINEIRDELRPDVSEEEKRRQRRKEYLSWWFSRRE